MATEPIGRGGALEEPESKVECAAAIHGEGPHVEVEREALAGGDVDVDEGGADAERRATDGAQLDLPRSPDRGAGVLDRYARGVAFAFRHQDRQALGNEGPIVVFGSTRDLD